MKKGAVTIFEIALLAVLATVLVVVYNVFAQTTVENIVLRTANTIQVQECTLTLLSVYNKDYKRVVNFEDKSGDYEKLIEFYDIPTKYEPKNLFSEVINYKVREGAGGNSKCSSFIFDPEKLYKNEKPIRWVSGE